MNKILWKDKVIYDFSEMEFIGEIFIKNSIYKNECENKKIYYLKEWDIFFQTVDNGYFDNCNKFVFINRKFQGSISIEDMINNFYMNNQDELAVGLYKRFVKM